jgi:hypothetical protein
VTLIKKCLLASWMFLHSAALAHAATPASADANRYAKRCHAQAAHRDRNLNGTMLWGTKRDWDTEKPAPEGSSVLVSAELASLRLAKPNVKALRIEKGHLVAVPAASRKTGAHADTGVAGTVLKGIASNGKPVEVAICEAEPSDSDPQVSWYRIEAWNSIAQEWENPCAGLSSVPNPRALAVSGVWDASGAHHTVPGKLTFACENGAITKCITWGYKPWESRDGHSLADLHQACTRMARADYCGDGHNHTHESTPLDMYDGLGVAKRTTEPSADFDPTQAAFEAAWAPDGATCMARTRDGRELETVLHECPNRFSTGKVTELGQGDRCTAQRVDVNPGSALLRNLSYLAPGSAR